MNPSFRGGLYGAIRNFLHGLCLRNQRMNRAQQDGSLSCRLPQRCLFAGSDGDDLPTGLHPHNSHHLNLLLHKTGQLSHFPPVFDMIFLFLVGEDRRLDGIPFGIPIDGHENALDHRHLCQSAHGCLSPFSTRTTFSSSPTSVFFSRDSSFLLA